MVPYDFMEVDYVDSFKVDGWFFTPELRRLYKNGNISYIPKHLHLVALDRLDHKKTNIYVGSATAVDKHGFVSLSTSNTYERRMIDAADLVIIEVNDKYPRTYGDVELHVNDIDIII